MKIFFIIIAVLISCSRQEEKKEAAVQPEKPAEQKLKRLIFFGDSLTAGYGLLPEENYVHLISEKLKQEGFNLEVVNAGVSGDTTATGLARLDWVIKKGADYFVLELGANDSMKGISISEIRSNLKKIISRVREKNPEVKILLVPMKVFPNYGPKYGKQFEKLYKEISEEENVPLSPFLLEKVAGIRKLNLPDGIHPTAEGHKLLFSTMYEPVKNLLKD